MSFPSQRMRRNRKTQTIRRMVREHDVRVDDLIYPMFAVHGSGIRKEIEAIRGAYHLSVDRLGDETKAVSDLGIPSVLLFGIPDHRDETASGAYDPNGIVPAALRALKHESPATVAIADLCLCEYTDHGHCGIMRDGYLQNDESLELLRKAAVAYARAGVDYVAPAAMLDGQISAIRSALDDAGFPNVGIMGYSAKYASTLYEPFFRHGTGSALTAGDKRSHQMDFGNSDEAMREIALDIEEGADIVMVKPGMFYLDIVYRAATEFQLPLAVYNVSGEHALISAAVNAGLVDEESVLKELMTSFKRAGADLIITYAAREIAQSLARGAW